MASHNKKRFSLVAGAVLILLLAGLTLLLDRRQTAADRYVALGDSFSAGMGLPSPAAGAVPRACLQSTHSYPHLVQARMRFTGFASAACSGATIADLRSAQPLSLGQSNAPQLERLTGDESLVTLSLSGNDAGFWGVILKCFSNDNPRATPCRDAYLHNGVNLLAERVNVVGRYFAAALDAVRHRSPKARVYVIGYAPIVSPDGAGCLRPMRASPADAVFFNGFESELNAMMRRAAQAHGARFIDIFAAGAGHDACQPPAVRWVEPRVGSRLIPNVQVHPNDAGQRAVARLILAALKDDGFAGAR